MIGLIGKKIGMTQIYKDNGVLCPSTVIEIGPCPVVQVKTGSGKDGYKAVKLGFWESEKISKPEKGIFEKAGVSPMKITHEFKVDNVEEYSVGTVLNADVFEAGEKVMVTGTTKGRGFAGVIKRYNFKGGDDTHGCRANRIPGSIGASSDPSRVFKGRHLPGHMGNKRTTVQNLKVVKVDVQNNLLLIKGHVPGCKNNLLMIGKAKKKQDKSQ